MRLVMHKRLAKHRRLAKHKRLNYWFKLLPGAGLTIDVAIGEAKETPRGAYEYIWYVEIKFIEFYFGLF